MEQEQPNVYRQALQKEIIAKQELLKEAREACTRLTESQNINSVSGKVWEQLTYRQMYTPNRSDPIGIAYLNQNLRMENEQSLLNDTEMKLKAMVDRQKSFNEDLKSVIAKLEGKYQKGINSETRNDNDTKAADVNMRINEVRTKIYALIKNNMAVDISGPDFPVEQATEKLTGLLNRLLEGDETLSVRDFEPHCMHFFRLLDKAYLLEKKEVDGEVYLRLEEFF